MSAHTPGPWKMDKPNPVGDIMILGGPSERYVALVHIRQIPRAMGLDAEPERTANAALIASAPDLLAALEIAALAISRGELPPVRWCVDTHMLIARAKGGRK